VTPPDGSRLRVRRWSTVTAVLAVVAVTGTLLIASRGGSANVEQPSEPAPESPAGLEDRTDVDAVPDEADEPEAAGGSLLLWARGGLDESVIEAARSLDGVVATAFVRSDTLGLVGSQDADGRAVDSLADGWRIPVFVAAIEPRAYASTLTDAHAPEETRATLASLRPGEVILSETAARLRTLGPGAVIDLDGLPGLRVAAVLPDGVVRRAEVIAHRSDAQALGLDPEGSLVVRHELTLDEVPRLARALEALGHGDEPARVSGAGVDEGRHSAPLVLSLGEIKARFGEFAYRPRSGAREIDVDPAWVDAHIVETMVPVLGRVRCHRAVIEDLEAAIEEIVAVGLDEHLAPHRYGGCHYPRRIRPDTDRLSSHSWGISIDINVDLDQPGLGPVPPDAIIEIFGRHGFRWGGDFTQPDNHHYEWIGEAATERP
jgi:hypothetical protein